MDTLGLNHLSWHRGFSYDGEDLWPEVFAGTLEELRAEEHPAWDPHLVEILGMMPNYYLQYFYYTDHKLAEQEKWPPSRAEAGDGDRGGPAAGVRRPEPDRSRRPT